MSYEQNFAEQWSIEDADVRHALTEGLVTCRQILRLSQRIVAKRMGTQQSAVAQIEKGTTDPRLGTFHRFARALGLTILLRLTPIDILPPEDPRAAWAYEKLVENELNYRDETWTHNRPVEGVILTSSHLNFWLEEIADRPCGEILINPCQSET